MDADLKKRLDERLVVGEIGRDEYLRILHALQGNADEQRSNRESVAMLTKPEQNTKRINWIPALALTCVSSFLDVIYDIASAANGEEASEPLLLLFLPVFIGSMVPFVILHHQLWKTIPPRLRVTTPAKAVGFIFIPVFNIYWAFITWPKLAEGIAQALGNPEEDLQQLAIWYAVVFSVSCLSIFIPDGFEYFSIVMTIAELVTFILLYRELSQKANALIKNLTT